MKQENNRPAPAVQPGDSGRKFNTQYFVENSRPKEGAGAIENDRDADGAERERIRRGGER